MATIWEGSYADIDPPTLRAIVQLQLQDIEELTSNAKGKEREGSAETDAQLALRLCMEDLQVSGRILQDRTMAQSIAVAVIQDGALISKEQQIARDSEIAASLDSETVLESPLQRPTNEQKSHADPWSDPEMLAKVAAIYNHRPDNHLPLFDSDSEGSTKGESSRTALARTTNDKPAPRICVICTEEREFHEVARVPCGHEYCRPCLADLFALSMKDETVFPPRCDGQEIPLASVRIFLPPVLAKEFGEKYEELSTKDRTYCFERSCAAFIPPSSINEDVATCDKCSRTTCRLCKEPSHSGDCPADLVLQGLLEIANQQQWQRCSQCKRLIELRTGCNHMTCPCGAQFCYVCGQPWRTCDCAQWDENRLYDRAAQLVDRSPRRRLVEPPRIRHAQPASVPPAIPSSRKGRRAAPPARGRVARARAVTNRASASDGESEQSMGEPDLWQDDMPTGDATPGTTELTDTHGDLASAEAAPTQASLIEAAAENLRANHACGHDRWRSIGGRHPCEECHDLLPLYIYECRQCHLRACNRCRRNRL